MSRWGRTRQDAVIVVVGVLMCLTIVVVAALSAADLYLTAPAAEQSRMLRIGPHLAEQIESRLEAVDLLEVDMLERMHADGIREPGDVRTRMANWAAHLDLQARAASLRQVDALAIHDADANLVNFSRYWPIPPVNLADRDYTVALKAGAGADSFISAPVSNRGTGTRTIYLARRINGPEGQYLGALVAAIELAHFERLLASVALPSATMTLLRQDRVLLARISSTPAGAVASAVEEAERQERIFVDVPLRGGTLTLRLETTRAAVLAWPVQFAILTAIGVVSLLVLISLAMLAMLGLSTSQQRVAQALTAAAKAEQRQLTALSGLKALMAAMPGVLIRRAVQPDRSLRTIFVSKSVGFMTGYSRAEAMGEHWPGASVTAHDMQQAARCEQHALVTGEATTELGFIRQDGEQRYFHAMMRRHVTPKGDLEVITVWSDVTRERSLNDALERSVRLAHLGEVATAMAHQLNQPLAVMSMAAENALRELARRDEPWPRLSRRLDVIVRMTSRAAGIIDNMRVFGRTGDDEVGPLSVAMVVQEAAGVVAGKLRDAGVQLQVAVPADLQPVLAKDIALQEVLANLLINASDAYIDKDLGQSGTPRVITVEASASGGRIFIMVGDKAGGIAEDSIGKVFQPFFTGRDEGRGLGLSMSFGIITELGGTISAENRNGGAVFRVDLPAFVAEPVAGEYAV